MRPIDADEMLKRAETWNTEDWMDKALYNFMRARIIEQPTVDIDAITESHERIGYDRGFRDGYAEALKETDNVPDKNVGEWIDVNGDGSLWRCSVCGETQCCYDNYCGNCGAKMDEVKDETD